MLESVVMFKVPLCRTAATVTVTEGQNNLIIYMLLLVSVPASLYLCRLEHSVVCSVAVYFIVLIATLCRKEVSENLC